MSAIDDLDMRSSIRARLEEALGMADSFGLDLCAIYIQHALEQLIVPAEDSAADVN